MPKKMGERKTMDKLRNDYEPAIGFLIPHKIVTHYLSVTYV